MIPALTALLEVARPAAQAAGGTAIPEPADAAPQEPVATP